jgi:hypothetical protein
MGDWCVVAFKGYLRNHTSENLGALRVADGMW